MAKKDAFSMRRTGEAVDAEKTGEIVNPSLPNPKEGLRLMHAFLTIKKAETREAIIKFVEEQSRLEKDE